MGMNVRTGKFMVFQAKATILTMSRPARVWLFNPDLVGLCEFRPTQSIGSGHAMGYRAGIEFTMMEKSVKGEFPLQAEVFRLMARAITTTPGMQPPWWTPEEWKSLMLTGMELS